MWCPSRGGEPRSATWAGETHFHQNEEGKFSPQQRSRRVATGLGMLRPCSRWSPVLLYALRRPPPEVTSNVDWRKGDGRDAGVARQILKEGGFSGVNAACRPCGIEPL